MNTNMSEENATLVAAISAGILSGQIKQINFTTAPAEGRLIVRGFLYGIGATTGVGATLLFGRAVKEVLGYLL